MPPVQPLERKSLAWIERNIDQPAHVAEKHLRREHCDYLIRRGWLERERRDVVSAVATISVDFFKLTEQGERIARGYEKPTREVVRP
jgi:hypothetical protein